MDTPKTHMHDRSLFLLDTGTLIKKKKKVAEFYQFYEPDSLLFVKLYSHASVSMVLVSLSAEFNVSYRTNKSYDTLRLTEHTYYVPFVALSWAN